MKIRRRVSFHQLFLQTSVVESLCVIQNDFFPLDVGSWKEGGGRGVMLQQQPKTDTPSSQPLTSPSQTETQQNGPQITSGASETQTQQMPPRPGSGPGPSQGPGMPMAPMGMHPQYRMMPPFVCSFYCKNNLLKTMQVPTNLYRPLHFCMFRYL